MRTTKYLYLSMALCVLFLLPSTAEARRRSRGLGLSIQPVIGYERVQKVAPTPHTSERLVYGGRLVLGVPLLSLEAEYTHASDSETFTSPSNLTTTDTAEKIKLGARSSFKLSRTVRFLARAGVQGTYNVHEEDDGSTVTRVEEPIEYDPYAGAGFRFRLGRRSKVAFVAEVTTIFKDINDLSQNEYLVTGALVIRISG